MAPIGAALLAGVGNGSYKDVYDASGRVEKRVIKTFRSNSVNDAVYQQRFETYVGLYPQLKDIFKQSGKGI